MAKTDHDFAAFEAAFATLASAPLLRDDGFARMEIEGDWIKMTGAGGSHSMVAATWTAARIWPAWQRFLDVCRKSFADARTEAFVAAPGTLLVVTARTITGGETVVETACNLTFAELCDDVWSGQVEGITRILAVDPFAGTSRNIVWQVAKALSERTFAEQYEPHHTLCDFIEGCGFDTYRDRAAA